MSVRGQFQGEVVFRPSEVKPYKPPQRIKRPEHFYVIRNPDSNKLYWVHKDDVRSELNRVAFVDMPLSFYAGRTQPVGTYIYPRTGNYIRLKRKHILIIKESA